MDTQVRNDIPIPAPYGRGSVDALRSLAKVGDSVLLQVRVSSLGTLTRRAGLTGRYTARKEADGVRVWLIRLPDGVEEV